jgi:hypothetical protein
VQTRKLSPAALRTCSVALVLTALAGPSPSHAEARPDETERWVPSVAVFGGIIGQTASGDVISGLVMGDQLPPLNLLCKTPLGTPDINCIRPPAAGEDTLLAATVGGSVELMTPRLFGAAGRPRLFAHTDFAAAFGFESTIAGEGAPGEFGLVAAAGTITNLSEGSVTGQGSRTLAEIQPFVLSAGLGVAFTLEFGHRRIRIKPSVEYMRETLDISGIVNRAVKIDNPAPPAEGLDNFRLISLTSSTTEIYHGVGPGLEFEADAVRAGPFVLSLFVAGQAYSIFGKRDIELSDTNEFGETAEWRFQKEKWGWGARAGLRFRWLPE